MVPEEPAHGLERHPSLVDRFDSAIRIVDFDPEWPARAEVDRRRIHKALGPLAVRLERVGSTAVPGLAAKPIVDLQVSVAALEPLGRYVEPLGRLDYIFVPGPEWPDFHFFAKPPGRPGRITCTSVLWAANHELRHLEVRFPPLPRPRGGAVRLVQAQSARPRGGTHRIGSPTSMRRSDMSAVSKPEPSHGPRKVSAAVSISRGLVRRPSRDTPNKRRHR